MSSFDTVQLDCPCGGMARLQSKSGPCMFEAYTHRDAPLQVLAGIANEIATCSRCGDELQLIVRHHTEVVPVEKESPMTKPSSIDIIIDDTDPPQQFFIEIESPSGSSVRLGNHIRREDGLLAIQFNLEQVLKILDPPWYAGSCCVSCGRPFFWGNVMYSRREGFECQECHDE